MPVDLLLLAVLLQQPGSTRIRRIHSTLIGIRASFAPFRLPWPVWRPLRFASAQALVRARECTFCGFASTKPSLISLRMFCRELAIEISLTSFGSSQILRLPHLSTDDARRFCSSSDTPMRLRGKAGEELGGAW